MERWQQDRVISREHERWLEPDEPDEPEDDEWNPFEFDRERDDY